MDDTAQNSNVTDIWSMVSQSNRQDDTNQPAPRGDPQTGGGFGKPGLAGGGETGYSQDRQEGRDEDQRTPVDESAKKLEVDKEALDLVEKARRREVEELAELHKPAEQGRLGEIQKSQETMKSPEVVKSPEIPVSPEVPKSPEVQRTKARKTQDKKLEQQSTNISGSPAPGKIVDKRTGKEKPHRVDANRADSVTKIADIKEQEFIERVEREHVKSIV